MGGVGGIGHGGHTVGARGGQQGVRARVHAAGKALEGDDRQMHIPCIIVSCLFSSTDVLVLCSLCVNINQILGSFIISTHIINIHLL